MLPPHTWRFPPGPSPFFLSTGQVGGITQYAPHFRSLFQDALVVEDAGDIPKEERVHRVNVCALSHPGLCKEKDKGRWTSVCALHAALVKFVLRVPRMEVGTALRIESTSEDGQTLHTTLLVLSFVRLRDPLVLVFAKLERVGDDALLLEQDRDNGFVKFALGTEVAAALWHERSVSLSIHVMTVQPKFGSLRALAVISTAPPAVVPLSDGGSSSSSAPRPTALDKLGEDLARGFALHRNTRSGADVQPSTRPSPRTQVEVSASPAQFDGEDLVDDEDPIGDTDLEALSFGLKDTALQKIAKDMAAADDDVCILAAPKDRPPAAGGCGAPMATDAGGAASARAEVVARPEELVASSLPPPPAPKRGAKRGLGYRKFVVRDFDGSEVGYLLWNANANSLDAHCCDQRHGVCRLNRTVRAHPLGTRPHQGRPLGLLVAWLHAGRSCSTRDEHFALRTGAGPNASLVSLAARQAARAMVENELDWSSFLRAEGFDERPVKQGEGLEPEGLA